MLVLTVIGLQALATETYTQADVLRLRAEPEVGSEVVTRVRIGTRATLIEAQAGWARIRIGAVEGWVKDDFLGEQPDAAALLERARAHPEEALWAERAVAVDPASDEAWRLLEAHDPARVERHISGGDPVTFAYCDQACTVVATWDGQRLTPVLAQGEQERTDPADHASLPWFVSPSSQPLPGERFVGATWRAVAGVLEGEPQVEQKLELGRGREGFIATAPMTPLSDAPQPATWDEVRAGLDAARQAHPHFSPAGGAVRRALGLFEVRLSFPYQPRSCGGEVTGPPTLSDQLFLMSEDWRVVAGPISAQAAREISWFEVQNGEHPFHVGFVTDQGGMDEAVGVLVVDGDQVHAEHVITHEGGC